MTETSAAPSFAILADHKQSERPLYMSGLTFGRLVDEIVIPYDSNEPFFIDGVPTQRADLKRIKIVRESPSLKQRVAELHWKLRTHQPAGIASLAGQYQILLEALVRDSGEDVTSQVLKAYSTAIKPRLKDYLPKREELIAGGFKVFIEAMKALASRPS
jgi:hypothetical protein